MRTFLRFGVLMTVAGLSLDCSGNFCDAYPHACVSDGGGGGSDGGGTPGQVAVQVRLLDFFGEEISSAPVVVSARNGQVLEQTDTSAGTVMADVGGSISVFTILDERGYVFSAEVAASTPALTFRMPLPDGLPEPITITVNITCVEVCDAVELSGSCLEPRSAAGTAITIDVGNYSGCRPDGVIELFAFAHDEGEPVRGAKKDTAVDPKVEAYSMLPLGVIGQDDRVKFSMPIASDLVGNYVRRSVRVPALGYGGFGYNRVTDVPDQVTEIWMAKFFTPRAEAQFSVTLPLGRSLFRQAWFESVEANNVAEVALYSLAVPAGPPPPELSEDGALTASYSLEEGPIGDAVQLRLGDASVEWTATLAPESAGTFRFPDLPAELESYRMGEVQTYEVRHIDRDVADSYEAFVSAEIESHAFQHGLESVTVTTSR